jgi:hypothetical protein
MMQMTLVMNRSMDTNAEIKGGHCPIIRKQAKIASVNVRKARFFTSLEIVCDTRDIHSGPAGIVSLFE